MSSTEPIQSIVRYDNYDSIFGFISCKILYMLGMFSREPLPYAGKYHTYAIIFGFVTCKTPVWVCPQGSPDNMVINTPHIIFI